MLFMFCLVAFFFGGLMVIGLLFGGGDHSLDHSLEHGHGESSESGWSGWFSIKVISAFGTAFGTSGALATLNDATKPFAILIAVFSGLVIAALVKRLIGFLMRNESSAAFDRSALLGKEGSIVLGIEAGGIGEAQFLVGGQLVTLPAKSADGKPVAQGSTVVVEAAGSVLVVRPKQA
jgi:membrane protein implicated in regulation of membrane protease activity